MELQIVGNLQKVEYIENESDDLYMGIERIMMKESIHLAEQTVQAYLLFMLC